MIRSKAINLSLSTALLVSMFGVAGCMTKEPANTNMNTKNVRNTDHDRRLGVNSLRNDGNWLTTRSNNNAMDEMTNLHTDRKLADKIAAIKGVRSANVFLTNDNAYVAVSLDNTVGSNTMNNLSVGRGASNTEGMSGVNGATGATGVNGVNGATGVNGVNGLNGANGVNGMNGQYGANSYRNESNGNRGLNDTTESGSYGLLRDMTSDNRNEGVNNNRSNTISNTGNTGNIGNTGNTNSNNIPTEIRKKITSIIQKQVPGIKKVYASSDPDFVQSLSTYATGANKGNNTNLVTDFKKLVYRIFPMHDSTMDPDK